MKRIAAALIIAMLAGLAAFAQNETSADGSAGGDDNGFILNFIQEKISGPGREIRLRGVQGALSSRATIGGITVSDDEGPWLEIENVTLDWSRLALLRRRVQINELSFESISVLRKPIPVETAPIPEAEAKPFALPELPVSLQLDKLLAQSVSIDESVMGEGVEFSLDGHASLADGALESGLEAKRLDEPGGNLLLDADYSNENRNITLDLDLQEPQGGLLSKLLKIEGEPALALKVAGAGPLDNVDIDFGLKANEATLADGVLALRGKEDGQGFDLALGGELSPLIPAEYRDFFADKTDLHVAGTSKTAGGLRIDALALKGAVLDLTGRLETGSDSFLRSLNLSGTLGDAARPGVVLPVPGGDTKLHSATLYVNYGDAARWDGIVALDRLEAGGIDIEDLTLDMGGLARNLEDPATREVTVSIDGLATGVSAEDPNVADALGTELDLFVDASLPPGAPIDLRQVQVNGKGLSLFAAGTLDKLDYDGRAAVHVPDLSILAGLLKRPASGAVELRAEGSVAPLSGKFDLTLDGQTRDVKLGDPRIDGLLAGETVIAGRAVRNEEGIRTDGLRIENPQVSIASDGLYSSARTDIGLNAKITDLARVDPRFAGTLTADARARGTGQPIDITAAIALPEGRIMGETAEGIRLGFTGQGNSGDLTGRLSGDGRIADMPLDLAGQITLAGEMRAVEDMRLSLGDTQLLASVARTGTAPVDGTISLQAPDLAPIGTLADLDMAGAVEATIALAGRDGAQDLGIEAAIRELGIGATRVQDLKTDLSISDVLGIPMAEGTIAGRGIVAGGVDLASINATAERGSDTSTDLTAQARLATGTLADLAGGLEKLPEGGFTARLSQIDIRQGDTAAHLAAPAEVTVQSGNIALTPIRLNLGDGALTAEGNVGETIDLSVGLDALPLSIANIILPKLGLNGTLDGNADISGPRNAPNVAFDLTGAGLGSEFGTSAGLPPINVDAKGTTADGSLSLDAAVTGGAAGGRDGLSATASGQIPLAADKSYNLTVDLKSLPLVLADRIAGNQGLRGALTGQAQVTGLQASPEARFKIDGSGLTVRMLSEGGVPPLALSVEGAYAQNAVNLASASVTGPYGLSLSGGGRIPLAGPGLDARLNGTVPLQLASPLLAARAASATGQLNINATAAGALADPRLNGNVSLSGGTFTDPDTNLKLENIRLDVALDTTRVLVRDISADVAAGGDISGSGSVELSGPRGYPADINMRFDDVRYTDGTLATTRFRGTLGVSGPLVGGGGQIRGRITLDKTEISIEEGLGSNAGAVLDEIQHLRPPPRVVETLRLADVNQPEDTASSSGGGGGGDGGFLLDIRVNAPNQVFIRGRGLDVELGGELSIQGTTSNPAPVGEFRLRRGRISILTQRVDFTEGALSLDGDLDPEVNFVAESRSGDVTAIITVSGRASDPDITFSSQPELPQDEVLSRLLFNRAAQDLSPFQIAQLAAAAAELAGVGGGPGVLSELRSATGLDNLDILTNEDGSTGVQAGKYVADDVYLDAQTNSNGETEVGVVYDVNDNITARGSVGSDGNTIFGLFFERDY